MLALALMSSAAAVEGSFVAEGMEGTGFAGNDAGVAYLAISGPPSATTALTGLVIEAPHLVAEGWYQDTNGLRLSVNRETVREHYYAGPATLRLSSPGVDHEAIVSSEGDGHALAMPPALLLSAHSVSEVPYPSYMPVPDADDRAFPVSESLAASELDAEELVFHGDMHLVLWDWNLTFGTPDGDVELWSGERRHAPPQEDPVNLQGYDRQLLELSIRNGTIRMPYDASWLKAAYITADELHLNGTTMLTGVQALAGNTLEIRGEHRVALDVQQGSFVADVRPVPAPSVATGPSITTSDPAPASPATTTTGTSWPHAGWLLVVVAFGVVVAVVRRERNRRLHERLAEALRIGHHEFVLRRAPLLEDHGRYGEDAQLWQVVAALKLNEAEQAHEMLQRMRAIPAPLHAFMSAAALAMQGQGARAKAHLDEAIAASPGLRADAARNDALRPLLDDKGGEAYA